MMTKNQVLKSLRTEGDKTGLCIDLVGHEGEGVGSVISGEITDVRREEQQQCGCALRGDLSSWSRPMHRACGRVSFFLLESFYPILLWELYILKFQK